MKKLIAAIIMFNGITASASDPVDIFNCKVFQGEDVVKFNFGTKDTFDHIVVKETERGYSISIYASKGNKLLGPSSIYRDGLWRSLHVEVEDSAGRVIVNQDSSIYDAATYNLRLRKEDIIISCLSGIDW